MIKHIAILLVAFAAALPAAAEEDIVMLTKDTEYIAQGTEVIVHTNRGRLWLSVGTSAGDYFFNVPNQVHKGACLYLSTETEMNFIEYNKKVDRSGVQLIKTASCKKRRAKREWEPN